MYYALNSTAAASAAKACLPGAAPVNKAECLLQGGEPVNKAQRMLTRCTEC